MLDITSQSGGHPTSEMLAPPAAFASSFASCECLLERMPDS